MTAPKTAALLIGFGGPSKIQTPRAFLENVLKGVPVPPERFEEVLHHYEAVGGVSPYIPNTFLQKEALERRFAEKGVKISVGAAFRHSSPTFRDGFDTMTRYGVERVIGFVLAAFRSYASFGKYTDRVEEGKKEAGSQAEVVYTEPFHDDPLFTSAQADRVLEQTKTLSGKTYFIFTAHSIPQKMSDESGYARQFEESSRLVAARLGAVDWSCAYQSRSGSPRDPWLEPDARDVVKGLPGGAFQNLLVVPIGFLCENVEILFDLDIELKETAESAGLRYVRASTVMAHPDFIELAAQRILAKVDLR
jgi:ferrochelatase